MQPDALPPRHTQAYTDEVRRRLRHLLQQHLRPMRIAELQRLTGAPQTTVHRALLWLRARGEVVRTARGFVTARVPAGSRPNEALVALSAIRAGESQALSQEAATLVLAYVLSVEKALDRATRRGAR